MKKFQGIIILIVFVVVFLVIKFIFFPGENHSNPSGSGKKGMPPKAPDLMVNAIIVKPESLDNTLTSSGSLKANEEVEIQPEVSGKITQLLFKEGSPVKKGQLLFKLNDLDLKANLQKLYYNLQLAKENEQRQAKLLEINGISQQDYDIAKNTVESTQSDIEFTRASISKTEVKAPFDGRIGLRYVSVGAFVSQSTKIATIQQIDPLKLDFSIPEQYSSQVKMGDRVKFLIQGNSQSFYAKVTAIEPRIDLNTRTLSIRALYRNSTDRFILPGTFASVSLVLHSSSNALMVPTESMVPVLKGQTLFVYHQGKVNQTGVETGIRTDTKIEITKGLAPGDTVITTGLLSLKSNQPVKIRKVS